MATSASLDHLLRSRWSQALSTAAFQDREITLKDLQTALVPARTRSLQRLMQALLREGLIEAEWLPQQDSGRVYLLADQSRVHFEHLSPGRMNSWDLRGEVTLQRADQTQQPILWPSQLLRVMSQSFAAPPSAAVLMRLAEELNDSLINDSLCLAYHDKWSQALTREFGEKDLLSGLSALQEPHNPSLLLEQWGALGHPWHPNYKTKLGLSVEQVIQYAPEFAARIDVRLCALYRQYAHVEALPGTGDYWQWWTHYFPQAATQLRQQLANQGLDSSDYLPLPAHPWQVEDALARDFACERADHLLVITDIVAFSAAPSMSFRTVLPEASRQAPMVKLPVALRLTSVQRTVSPRSARMGPRVSQLLLQILAREPEIAQHLDIVPERLGIHYLPCPANDDHARHLGALYRDNPYSRLSAGEVPIPVGSLFAFDENQRPLLRQWVKIATGADDSGAMLTFFDRYASIAVPALLGIYLKYGVAFEAHQQNSFMVMGLDGRPARLLIRDFGDIRIDRASLHAQGLDIDQYDPQLTLFDDDGFVRDKLLHTTFMCHLGELVLLCARHWQVPEAPLWEVLATKVTECFQDLKGQVEPGRWQRERQALLENDWPAKAFMRMRLSDDQADIVGRLTNPLRAEPDAR